MKRIAGIFMIALLWVTIGGCKKTDTDPPPEDKGACGNGKREFEMNVNVERKPLKTYTGGLPAQNEVQIFYMGDSVQFITGQRLYDACSKEHLNITYSIRFHSGVVQSHVHVFGEAYYGVSSRSVTLLNGVFQHGQLYHNSLEVGLGQQFENKPADVDVFLTVQFKSRGTRALDSIEFFNAVSNMTAASRYSEF